MPEQMKLFPMEDAGASAPAGRPKREFSQQEQELVERLLAAGKTTHEIAAQIGCSQPTLRHFFQGGPGWNPHGKGPKTKENQDE